MAQEYKRRGGGYKSEQDESQQHLEKWAEEEWQTKEGSGHAKKADGTEKRYLPKRAWEQMTEEEKEATDEKKQAEGKEGKQFVGNTEKAKQSRKTANREEDAKFEQKEARETRGMRSATKIGDDDADGETEANAAEDGNVDAAEHERRKANTGQKRKAGKQEPAKGSSKERKPNDEGGNAPPGKVGSKHMDATEPAPRGSVGRLPKEKQQVTWKAMPGYVDGVVQEILTKAKNVDGKSVKASRNDPKIVLKSNSSGKICVHKPDACFYE